MAKKTLKVRKRTKAKGLAALRLKSRLRVKV